MTSEKHENYETPAVENKSAETISIKSDFISQIEAAFAKRLPADVDIDAFVEKIIDAYLDSPQNKRYDDDFFLDIIKPVMVQIIRLKDGLEKDCRTFNGLLSKNDVINALSFAQKALDGIREEFVDILDYYDVVPFKVEGNKFNPLKQTVVKPIPTSDETLFKIVSESLGCGYERNGRVINKERVSAYVVEKVTE